MSHTISDYSDDYEWVKVKGLQRFNITGYRKGRPWTQGKNISISEGEELILPRGKVDGDGYAEGMNHFYKNDGFLEVVDTDPEEVSKSKSAKYECEECDRIFDSKQGLRAHSSQKHETNKKEEKED